MHKSEVTLLLRGQGYGSHRGRTTWSCWCWQPTVLTCGTSVMASASASGGRRPPRPRPGRPSPSATPTGRRRTGPCWPCPTAVCASSNWLCSAARRPLPITPHRHRWRCCPSLPSSPSAPESSCVWPATDYRPPIRPPSSTASCPKLASNPRWCVLKGAWVY